MTVHAESVPTGSTYRHVLRLEHLHAEEAVQEEHKARLVARPIVDPRGVPKAAREVGQKLDQRRVLVLVKKINHR